MIPHAKDELQQPTLDAIQKLIRLNIDSARALGQAAKAAENPHIAQELEAISAERRAAADALEANVARNDERPAETGTVKGTLHRGWMKLRAALSDGDLAVMTEAERAEDTLKDAYEVAIVATVGSPVADVLHHQLRKVKSRHDEIRELRDALAA